MCYTLLTKMEIMNRIKMNYHDLFINKEMKLPTLTIPILTYKGIDLNDIESKILEGDFKTIPNDGVRVYVGGKILDFINVFNYELAMFETSNCQKYKFNNRNGFLKIKYPTSNKWVEAKLHPTLKGQIPTNTNYCKVHRNNDKYYIVGWVGDEKEKRIDRWEGTEY